MGIILERILVVTGKLKTDVMKGELLYQTENGAVSSQCYDVCSWQESHPHITKVMAFDEVATFQHYMGSLQRRRIGVQLLCQVFFLAQVDDACGAAA